MREGIIKSGKVFSDCLIPEFIDVINQILEEPKQEFIYREEGITQFCSMYHNLRVLDLLHNQCKDDEFYHDLIKSYIEDIKEILLKNIIMD